MSRTLLTPLLLLISTALFGTQPTAITLKTSAATVEYGHPVTLTALVSPATAPGEVTFYSGVTILETEPMAGGTATFTTTLLPFGAQPLTAHYSGNATYAPSTSAALVETVKTAVSRGFAAPLFSGPTYCYGQLAIGDFNGDGKPDLAIASSCPDGLNVLIGNGDGTFQEPVSYPIGGLGVGQAVAVGDFNGDGKMDLAVTENYGGLSILLGNGDGTFQPAVNSIFEGIDIGPIAIGDFNGDGKADIAGGEFGLTVFLGNGDGTFQPPITYSLLQQSGPVVADFNGDGKADVAVFGYDLGTGYSFVDVYVGNGDGTFQPPLMTSLTSQYSSALSLAPGDFNGDGKADLAVNTEAGVAVLLGNGDGTFQPAGYYVDNYGTYPDVYNGTIEVGDLNGDGIADLVSIVFEPGSVLNTGVNVVDVLLGKGDGTFQPPRNSPSEFTNGEYIWTALADLNGDGKVDLVESILYIAVSAQLGTLVGPTATTLSSSLNPSVFGESVTLTATVSPSVLSGIVTFYNGSTELGTGNVKDGTATLTLSTLPVGSLSLTAMYSGSAYELTSTSNPFFLQVIMSPSSTTLLASPNPSALGQTVTLIAEVAPAGAAGNVTFYSGTAVLGNVALVNGKAKMTTSTLPKGRHALSATYFGNADYDASVSATVNETVN